MFEKVQSSQNKIPSNAPKASEQNNPTGMFQQAKEEPAPIPKKPTNVIIEELEKNAPTEGSTVLSIDDHETKINRKNILIVVGALIGTLIILTVIGFLIVQRLAKNDSENNESVITNTEAPIVNTRQSNINSSFVNVSQNTNTIGVTGVCHYTDMTETIINPSKDTDNDGLADSTEHTYGTSIYIADTDNDGYTDGQEVNGGYNPCGAGKLQ